MKKQQILYGTLVVFILLAISYIAIYVRLATINTPTVLDYDPWYVFRYAKTIVQNNYQIPKWDMLTYYPPGRPVQPFQGWPYTIALIYKLLSQFISGITVSQVTIISPLIVVAAIVIPTFLLGKLLSNTIGGVTAVIFATLTPAFITLSVAGYSTTNSIETFYTFLTILTTLLAVRYSRLGIKSLIFYALAVISNVLFIFNWGGGWFTGLLFIAFLPLLIGFRALEEIIKNKKIRIYWKESLQDAKPLIIPLFIILVTTNIVAFLFGLPTILDSFFNALAFTGIGHQLALIVNISVAELQPINIFTVNGFLSVADRVGILPTILTMLCLPLLVIYKLYRKEKISFIEVFLFVWALVSFYLISTGVRFSLQFSSAAAITASYVIGNLFNYFKDKNTIIFSGVSGVLIFLLLIFTANAFQVGQATSQGLTISDNWYSALDWLKAHGDNNTLVATWWDPGHIITGYTGLKVHADGAHCADLCIPYNHNIRIQDMGKILSTDNESESIQLLKKYTYLTPEQCNSVKERYGPIVPADACNNITSVYVLATDDIIGKYYWVTCFGNFDMNLWESTGGKKWSCDGKNFISLQFSNFDSQGFAVYTQGDFTISLAQNGTDVLAIVNAPSQGIRNALVSDVVYFQNGQMIHSKPNTNNTINGMVWVDPSFRAVIFMDASIRDSVFTKMFFFNGQGLSDFELVYQNPQVKIFKAKLD